MTGGAKNPASPAPGRAAKRPEGCARSNLPDSREDFLRELGRRLALFARELATLAGSFESADRSDTQDSSQAIEQLVSGLAEMSAELRTASTSDDAAWLEARGRLATRWWEFRMEFERLALLEKRPAADGERGASGPRH